MIRSISDVAELARFSPSSRCHAWQAFVTTTENSVSCDLCRVTAQCKRIHCYADATFSHLRQERCMSTFPHAERYNQMEYRRCGRSGLKLPAISLGLWHNFGDTTRVRQQPRADASRVRSRYYPFRSGQQLRAAARLRRGELWPHTARRFSRPGATS